MKGRGLSRFRFRREHRWTHSHLSEYLDSELDQGGRDRVERHVGICPDCHRVLATLRRVIDGLRAIGTDRGTEPDPPTDSSSSSVSDGVLARFRKTG
jgi:hypothetical protein